MTWTVYTLFGVSGEPLYVGHTGDLARRLREHHAGPMSGLIERHEVEAHATRAEAMRREAQLIERLRPPHNRVLPHSDSKHLRHPRRSAGLLLAEERLGCDIYAHVSELRGKGISWRHIAIHIFDASGVDLSPETIRTWFASHPAGVSA